MRLVDIAIPKFDEDVTLDPPEPAKGLSSSFQLPALFGPAEPEYNIDDEDDHAGPDDIGQDDQFFDAIDGAAQVKFQSNCNGFILLFSIRNLNFNSTFLN